MSVSSGFDADRLSRISSWMQSQVDARRLAGLAVQISRHDETVFSKCAGMQDVENGIAVRADALWRIYSMTKPITSLAAMMLYEEGAFQLDQPVADFLPCFRDLRVWKGGKHALDDTEILKRDITIHDLLTHQSGFVYADPKGTALERALAKAGLDFDQDVPTMKEAVARLVELPLAFQPGRRWFYGLSTDVLGHLIEVVSGVSLETFFRRRIFEPLDMTETGFEVPKEKARRLAVLYEKSDIGFVKVADQGIHVPPKTLQSGGAGLISTVSDYQCFANMLLRRGAYDGGQLVGRKTFDLMVSNHMGGDLASRGQAHFSETTMEGIGFGLGMSVMLDPTRAKIIGSAGEFAWGGWASTAFWVDPVEEITVILMTQLAPSSAYTLRRQLRVLSYQSLI